MGVLQTLLAAISPVHMAWQSLYEATGAHVPSLGRRRRCIVLQSSMRPRVRINQEQWFGIVWLRPAHSEEILGRFLKASKESSKWSVLS